MIQLFLARLGLTFAGHGLKVALVLGIAATVATWDRGRIKQAEQRGVQTERASVYQKSKINASKATAARRSADSLPPDRLRDKFCRDC